MKTIWVNVTRQLRSTHANQPSVKDILPKQNSCNDAVMTLLCSKLGSNYKKMQKSFVKMICKHRVIKETVFTHFSNRGQESNSTSRSIHQNCYQNANELASMTFLLSVHIKSRSSRQIINESSLRANYLLRNIQSII